MRNPFYILAEDGTVVPEPDYHTWLQWYVSHAPVIKKTSIATNVYVNTLFLGVNAKINTTTPEPPMLFETWVIGGPLDSATEYYATRADAFAGHDRWVGYAKALTAEAKEEGEFA